MARRRGFDWKRAFERQHGFAPAVAAEPQTLPEAVLQPAASGEPAGAGLPDDLAPAALPDSPPLDGTVLSPEPGALVPLVEPIPETAHRRLQAHAMELGLVVIPLSREGRRRLGDMALASGMQLDELAASIVEAVLADDEAAHRERGR